MPAVKQPCLQCKDKHVKCDEDKPKCKRCRLRKLPCTRPPKPTVFKQTDGGFSKDQQWVNSEPKRFRFHARGESAVKGPKSPAWSPDDELSPKSPWSPKNVSSEAQDTLPLSPRHPFLPPIDQLTPGLFRPSLPFTESNPVVRRFPLEDVQEACLLRYYIEEISHWFDLCDESRHFHLVVPLQAQQYPHLLNAIFAVSARHLCRLPQYKTPRGILYHGQLLPSLDEHAAVEYMLQCMPALREFHDVHDDDYRDSIIATAVILRQLEEIDNQDDEPQVNFLAIIDAVLRSPPSQVVFGRRSLMQAAYWMALRQEIFHSFTRWEAPQLLLPEEFWQSASKANKTVMHIVQVAKWRWGGSSEAEWSEFTMTHGAMLTIGRLMDQQAHLENVILADVLPIYKRDADKSRGEIFPTVWYRSNIDVTSMQLSLLAKSVLVAENPSLGPASRSSWRQMENQVRQLLLEQCGIALCNPASPPALVHAAYGIQLYGDFFTDQYERRAIRGVVERYRDTHAWPVERLLNMFN